MFYMSMTSLSILRCESLVRLSMKGKIEAKKKIDRKIANKRMDLGTRASTESNTKKRFCTLWSLPYE